MWNDVQFSYVYEEGNDYNSTDNNNKNYSHCFQISTSQAGLIIRDPSTHILASSLVSHFLTNTCHYHAVIFLSVFFYLTLLITILWSLFFVVIPSVFTLRHLLHCRHTNDRRLYLCVSFTLVRCLSGLHDPTQTHNTWLDYSGRVISPTQRLLPDNTKESQKTGVYASGGIRTRNPSKRAAADPRL